MSRNFVRSLSATMLLASAVIILYADGVIVSLWWALAPFGIVIAVFAIYGAIMYWMLSGIADTVAPTLPDEDKK